jgi:hypothetical protein
MYDNNMKLNIFFSSRGEWCQEGLFKLKNMIIVLVSNLDVFNPIFDHVKGLQLNIIETRYFYTLKYN